tara:strand:+ start:339 stop:659 length:321 start_codon:yes stop_codon:yes gene_type:complete
MELVNYNVMMSNDWMTESVELDISNHNIEYFTQDVLDSYEDGNELLPISNSDLINWNNIAKDVFQLYAEDGKVDEENEWYWIQLEAEWAKYLRNDNSDYCRYPIYH